MATVGVKGLIWLIIWILNSRPICQSSPQQSAVFYDADGLDAKPMVMTVITICLVWAESITSHITGGFRQGSQRVPPLLSKSEHVYCLKGQILGKGHKRNLNVPKNCPGFRCGSQTPYLRIKTADSRWGKGKEMGVDKKESQEEWGERRHGKRYHSLFLLFLDPPGPLYTDQT